ncbi:MAG: S9 family peptidase, partial [Edaphobacter sp.]
MSRVIAVCVLAVAFGSGASARSEGFTLNQALSAPYASGLVANQKTGGLAWVEDEQGRRNLWMAKPDGSGKYESKRVTSYDQDDGQDIYQVRWTPDGEHLVYVRGGDSEFPGTRDPNPALEPGGVTQGIWLVAAAGGEPRELG